MSVISLSILGIVLLGVIATFVMWVSFSINGIRNKLNEHRYRISNISDTLVSQREDIRNVKLTAVDVDNELKTTKTFIKDLEDKIERIDTTNSVHSLQIQTMQNDVEKRIKYLRDKTNVKFNLCIHCKHAERTLSGSILDGEDDLTEVFNCKLTDTRIQSPSMHCCSKFKRD